MGQDAGALHAPLLSVQDLRTYFHTEDGVVPAGGTLGIVDESGCGKSVERADVATLFREGRHPYTEGLLGSLPNPTEEREELVAIEGVVPSPHADARSPRGPHRGGVVMGTEAAAADTPLVEVRDLYKHFPVRSGLLSRRTGAVHAVDGVSFTLRRGECMGLVR